MRLSITRDAHLVHQKQVLEQHQVLEETVRAEVFELLVVQLQRAAIDERVFESEHRVLVVCLLVGTLNHRVAELARQCVC